MKQYTSTGFKRCQECVCDSSMGAVPVATPTEPRFSFDKHCHRTIYTHTRVCRETIIQQESRIPSLHIDCNRDLEE